MNNKKNALHLGISFLLAIIAYIIISFWNIPSEISLLEDSSQDFEFNLPANATISSSDKSINATQNSEAIESIDLNKPFSLATNQQANGTMKISFLGIPVRTVSLSVIPQTYLIPSGRSAGIRIDADGIMVLGLGEVNGSDGKAYSPAKEKLRAGDIITNANGKRIYRKEELMQAVEASNSSLKLTIRRNNKQIETTLTPVKGIEDNENKIGIWVRDSTKGIGTITFVNPENGSFGALGHPITDIDTGNIISIKSGSLMQTAITSVAKGERGSPGELIGEITNEGTIGEISENTQSGIFGNIYPQKISFLAATEPCPIALKSEITEGEATILANVDNEKIEQFDIRIEKINDHSSHPGKSMIIRITDERLLNCTGGIVQGMSGSPILQNGKIVGAVTHVLVNDPSRGYGIFIENMLEH